jgi:putative ABC transport system permease protein
MSTSALLLSLLLVQLLLPTLNSLTDKNLILFLGRDLSLILFLIGLTLMVGLVAGSYPALFLSASSTVQALRASSGFRSRRSVFRLITVVGQFTISVLLITCTLMIFKQLNYIQRRPLGFKTDYVLQMRNNPSLTRQFYSLKRELLSNPHISQVTRAQAVPYNDDFKTGGLEWEGKDPDLLPNVRYSITDYGFFETFDMEMVEGRSFSQSMPGDRRNYIINQTAGRYLGLVDPVGKPLSFWNQPGQIIGVVKDFHHVAMHREIMPHVFTINPNFQNRWIKYIFIKISSENIPDTIRFIEQTAQKIAPNFPSAIIFLDQGIADLYGSEQKLGKILTYFAFLAIFISCLGILGLSAFTVEQRTKEIGIRKIMGSSAAGIVALLSKQFSRWILVANLIAWPVAYYAMFTWLKEFAYRTHISLPLFILAGVLSLCIASLPIVYQALKAAKADPVDSLRYE